MEMYRIYVVITLHPALGTAVPVSAQNRFLKAANDSVPLLVTSQQHCLLLDFTQPRPSCMCVPCTMRQGQVWDARTNIVTVAPAEPVLTQSAETAMIISRLLVIALGILWILMLLVIGGAFGVDAADVPVGEATHAAQALPVASSSAGNEHGGARKRSSLLEEALGLHRRGDFEDAAQAYSRLLEVSQEGNLFIGVPDSLSVLYSHRISQR